MDDTITPEIVPKERKGGLKHGDMIGRTAKAVSLIAEHGLPVKEAYMIASGGNMPSPATVSRLKEKVERWSLRHPAALKVASKTIRSFAKGEDVNGIAPKDSTVLAAAQRIIDASEPVVKMQQNLNVNVDIHPVDLDKYLGI